MLNKNRKTKKFPKTMKQLLEDFERRLLLEKIDNRLLKIIKDRKDEFWCGTDRKDNQKSQKEKNKSKKK